MMPARLGLQHIRSAFVLTMVMHDKKRGGCEARAIPLAFAKRIIGERT